MPIKKCKPTKQHKEDSDKIQDDMAEDANEYGNNLNTDSEDELDIIRDKFAGGGNNFEACKSESDWVELDQ